MYIDFNTLFTFVSKSDEQSILAAIVLSRAINFVVNVISKFG
jgi:hypothetical protein